MREKIGKFNRELADQGVKALPKRRCTHTLVPKTDIGKPRRNSLLLSGCYHSLASPFLLSAKFRKVALCVTGG
jgi:hypothetical protein